MWSKNRIPLSLIKMFLLVLSVFSPAFAQEDLPESKDHPLVSRFPGSYIINYAMNEFNEYDIPLGKVVKGKVEKSQKLEGKVTQITYAAAVDKSVTEIYRNYELALKNSGFEILISANKKELGEEWLKEYLGATERPKRYGEPELNTRLGDDFRYLAAKLKTAAADVFVALCVGSSWFQKFPVIQLDVIEVKPMQTGLIKVTAEALAEDIVNKGHVLV